MIIVSLFTFNSKFLIKNKNIKFLLYFVIAIVFLDFLVGFFFERFYFSENSKKNDPLIHAVLETNEDILVLGSSRALHHYNPKIIQDSTELTCYNVGSGSQNIYYHLAILEATLERYRPKVVVLELMNIDFEVTPPQWETEKLGVLLPFFNKSEGVKKAVLRRGVSEKAKTLSSVYPFNSIFYTSFRNNFFPIRNNINGFIPIEKVWNKSIENETLSIVKPDSNKIEALFNFIELCKTNEVQTFIFVSPYFSAKNGQGKYESISTEIQKRYGIKILNLENDSLFMKNKQLFADPGHLNSKGADNYTSIVSKIIKQNYIKN